jgi:hypothetical protein
MSHIHCGFEAYIGTPVACYIYRESECVPTRLVPGGTLIESIV